MGEIVRFRQRHARAPSTTSARRAATSAKTSSVISGLSFSANRTTADQRSAGMPRGRLRQLLTVEAASPSASATVPVPPSAPMIESQVHISSVMETDIVRNMRTCQGFATRETTFRTECGALLVMDTDDDVIARLIAVREREGMNQAQFAGALGLGKNVYNPFETGKRPLTLDAARRIRRRFGISVDWLLFGDIGQPSESVARELGPNPGEKSKAKAPAKRRA